MYIKLPNIYNPVSNNQVKVLTNIIIIIESKIVPSQTFSNLAVHKFFKIIMITHNFSISNHV